jgi:hypothetical protein
MLIFFTKNPIITLCFISFIFCFNLQAQQENVQRDSRVDSLLAIKIDMQKKHLIGDNYTIQIHSGTLADGQSVMTEFKSAFPQWPAVVHYETPNYKVWAGNFSVRLHADQALKSIQRKFPSAFIFKPSLMRKEIQITEEDSEDQNPQASGDQKNKVEQ